MKGTLKCKIFGHKWLGMELRYHCPGQIRGVTLERDYYRVWVPSDNCYNCGLSKEDVYGNKETEGSGAGVSI